MFTKAAEAVSPMMQELRISGQRQSVLFTKVQLIIQPTRILSLMYGKGHEELPMDPIEVPLIWIHVANWLF